MRRARRIAGLVLAGMLATAPGATGASWYTGTRAPGPVAIAGPFVEWLAPLRSGATALYAARAGRQQRRLQSFARPSGNSSAQPTRFAASASAVVLERTIEVPGAPGDGDSKGKDLFAGGVAERLTSMLRCDGAPGVSGADVSRSVLAFRRCDGSLEIRDLTGREPPEVVGTDPHEPAIAGRYVAWLDGPYLGTSSQADLVVYDHTLGREVYRIPAASIPGQVNALSVQGDGKVVFTYYADPSDVRKGVAVAWSSPAHPVVHDTGLAHRFEYVVKIAHDRIVFARFAKSQRTDDEEVGISDLRGRARVLSHRARGLALDYDGTHISYVERTCRGYRVLEIGPSTKRVRLPRCR